MGLRRFVCAIGLLWLALPTASAIEPLSVKGSYILPIYPELAAGARVEGSFKVQVHTRSSSPASKILRMGFWHQQGF
jgi:hypothetical protein